jgi:CHAT domain-containing protein/tetratricopeptide (TPR) repeat protein
MRNLRVKRQSLLWIAIVAVTALLAPMPLRAQLADAENLDRGQFLHRQHDYDRALPYLEKTLQAINAGRLNEEEYLGRCFMPLVDVYFEAGRFQEALPLNERLLKWLEARPQSASIRWKILDYRTRLGDIQAALGQMQDARATWRKALDNARGDTDISEYQRLQVAWRMLDPVTNPDSMREERQRFAQATRAERKKVSGEKLPRAETIGELARMEALALISLDDTKAAVEVYRDSISRVQGTAMYPNAIMQLAVWEREIGDFAASEARLEAFSRYPGYRAFEPAAQEQLGLTLKAAGKSEEAAACWRKVIAAEAAAPKPKRVTLAAQLATLDRLRTAHEELREFPEALAMAERSFELLDKQPHASVAQRRRVHDILGALCASTGDYARAEKQLRASLELVEKDPKALADTRLTTLTNLGNVLRKAGKSAEAEQCFRESLQLCEKKLAHTDLRIAEAKSNVAVVLSDQGRYAAAVALLQEALASAEQADEQGKVLRASLLQFLAVTYLTQGQLDRAAQHLQQAIDAEQPITPDAARRLIERYTALAQLELARHRLEPAEMACRHAKEIADTARLGADPVAARLQRLSGQLALARRDFSGAEQYWLAALDSQQKRRANIDAARTLADLGDLAVTRKEFDAAEKYYRRALAEQADVHNLPILHYNILGNLGQVLYYSQQERQQGLELLKQAADLLEIPRAATTGGGERQRAEFLARHATVFDLLVDNSLVAGSTADAFHYAERARNRTFLDQLQLAGVDLRETLPASAAMLKTRESDLAAEIAKLRTQASTATGDAAKQLAKKVRQSQQDYAGVWGEIRDASPFYRELLEKRQTIGALADVQRDAIPADALMLFYVLGDFQSHLLVVGHEANDVTVFDLKLPAPLVEELHAETDWLTRSTAVRLVDEYLAALRSVEGGRGLAGVVQSPKGFMKADRGRLVTEVFLPAAVRKLLAARAPDHVIVVPDGAVHELPLECLVIAPGERPVFALDTLPPLTYAPSATILQSLVSRPKGAEITGAEMLSVGNPKYGEGPNGGEFAVARDAFVDLGGRLSALPGTLAECRRATAAFGADRSVLLVGEQATEAGVRASIQGRRFVHLAAHGLVDEQTDNLFGAIALSPSADFTADDDGFLTLHEIYALNLGTCELAALSACQTNVGGDRPLEAGSTLARAFLAAGARRVVCSQWNVDDEAGSELVATLWEEIAATQKRGEPVHYAKALRNAQRRIRQRPEYQSAYYWAPFVLIGPATAR